MATRKSSTRKTTTTKKKTSGRAFQVDYQKPGELPTKVSVKPNTKLSEFVADMALDGYVVSVNGSTRNSKDYIIKKDDTIRIGLKTKNNKWPKWAECLKSI